MIRRSGRRTGRSFPASPAGPKHAHSLRVPLCPGGCALKARRVNGYPVNMTGISDHPVSYGILCPAGITGHHLATHPLRLRQPHVFSGKGPDSTLVPASLELAVSDIAKTIREIQSSGARGTIAVLDHRPGRALSRCYQEFLAKCPDGVYVVAPGSEDATLGTLRSLCGFGNGVPGYDFEHTRVILSFGAPLLDGWGTPGRMMTLLQNRKQTGLKLIQAEGIQSRTALQADTWLPVRPGTEAMLALAIANTILREGLQHHQARQSHCRLHRPTNKLWLDSIPMPLQKPAAFLRRPSSGLRARSRRRRPLSSPAPIRQAGRLTPPPRSSLRASTSFSATSAGREESGSTGTLRHHRHPR